MSGNNLNLSLNTFRVGSNNANVCFPKFGMKIAPKLGISPFGVSGLSGGLTNGSSHLGW